MNTIAISKLLEQTTYVVNAFDGNDLYSEGSAFCVSENGMLITAGHVVTGRLPIKPEDYKDPNLILRARLSKGEFIQYRPVVCGITIDFPGPLREPLQIDLAVLNPLEDRQRVPHLAVSNQVFPVGTRVLMAGFPDELELPLLWDQALNFDHGRTKRNKEEVNEEIRKLRQMLMVKSGMIAHKNDLIFDPDGSGNWKLELGIYYIDNAMHSGASGGPVVNERGEVIGVITKRAVTRVSYPDLEDPNKEVPSGSALAVTPMTVISFIERQLAAGNVEKYT